MPRRRERHRCELGQWLHGKGQRFGNLAEFAQLVRDHAQFHAAAGEIIRGADAGKIARGDLALGGKSEYARVSIAVVESLTKMKATLVA